MAFENRYRRNLTLLSFLGGLEFSCRQRGACLALRFGRGYARAVFTIIHFVDPDLMALRGAPVSLSSMPFFKASNPQSGLHPLRYELFLQPIQIPTRWLPSSSLGRSMIRADEAAV